MSVPKKLVILSDKTELEYKGTIKPVKTTLVYYQYQYTKSKTKMGMLLGLSPEQLQSMIKNNIAKEI